MAGPVLQESREQDRAQMDDYLDLLCSAVQFHRDGVARQPVCRHGQVGSGSSLLDALAEASAVDKQ